MIRFRAFWVMGFMVILCACANPKHSESPNIAWYWWKTVYNPNDAELSYFKSCSSKRLALRLFDIDTLKGFEGPVPKAIVKQVQNPPENAEWIPVVYITRAALLNPGNLDSLACHIAKLTRQLCKEKKWQEIQWDHDWTINTRQTYFWLLEKLKQQDVFKGKQFTATIRLHQLKQIQPKELPPVDKGLLMVYNMGNLTHFETDNSIFSEAALLAYMPYLNNYPLPLDWALPVFAWTIQFRQNKFVAIMNGLCNEELKQSGLVDELPNHRYRCRQAGTIKGFFVQAGDILRAEACHVEMLKHAISILQSHRKSTAAYLYFFDWQEQHIPYFSPYDIQAVATNK